MLSTKVGNAHKKTYSHVHLHSCVLSDPPVSINGVVQMNISNRLYLILIFFFKMYCIFFFIGSVINDCTQVVPDYRNHGQAHVDNVDCVAGRWGSMQCIKDTWLKMKMPTFLKMLTFLNKKVKKVIGSQFLSRKSWKMVTESQLVF